MAGVCKVCLESVDGWVRERVEVEVEDGVALGHEVRDYVATSFA